MEALLEIGTVLGTDPADVLILNRVGLSDLGIAYIFFLGNALATGIFFFASRTLIVVSPNRATRDYGLYVAVVLVTLFVATLLENELLPAGDASLRYAAAPHFLVLFVIHLWIYYRQEPRLVALGVCSIAGTIPVVGIAAMTTDAIHTAHLVALGAVCALLGFVCYKSVNTKGSFAKAFSIYAKSKEEHGGTIVLALQRPWLGLPQWVALVCASLVLAVMNELLRGSTVATVPAAQVLMEAVLLLGATVLVSSIPAAVFWLARRAWMPELSRFVWLVWLVVGFGFSYSNFLLSMNRS